MTESGRVVACPKCQTRMRVAATGQAFRCPKCGQSIQVKAAAATAVDAGPTRPQVTPPRPAAPRPAANPVAAAPFPTAGGFPGTVSSAANPPWGNNGAQVGYPGAGAAPATKGGEASAASSKKGSALWILVGVGSTGLLFLFLAVGALLYFQPWNTSADPQAVAAANAPGNAAAPANGGAGNAPGGDQDGPKRDSSVPYVGLDHIIWKPGDKMPEKEEGSGPRTPLVGHSMQAKEVRTVEWKIVAAYSSPGDRQAIGEQTLANMDGYIPGSLVIDESRQVVSLKYKGTVLTAGHYRTQLELATELNLDPEPRFPHPE